MSTFPKRLKQRVDEVCAERGISVYDMADDLQIGRTRFRHYWERGSRPDHDLMRKIADYLNMDLNWLYGRDASHEWPKVNQMDSIQDKLSEIAKKLGG